MHDYIVGWLRYWILVLYVLLLKRLIRASKYRVDDSNDGKVSDMTSSLRITTPTRTLPLLQSIEVQV